MAPVAAGPACASLGIPLVDSRMRGASIRRDNYHKAKLGLRFSDIVVANNSGNTITTHTPQGRYGKPEDLVGTLLWLLSDDASGFVTGQVIAIDGAQGIMGSGTFSNLLKMTEGDWQKARESIKKTNEADKAKRTV